jgi:hypothetical protein
MPTLALTITGPFAFVDNTYAGKPFDGFITLMAPLCSQHLAGLAGIEKGNQYVFKKGVNCRNHNAGCSNCDSFIYQLMIGVTKPNVCQPSGLQVLNPVPKKPYNPREWRFWLTLPRPDTFVEINPVLAEIIKNDIGGQQDYYAIGLRFIYKNWDGKSIPLYLNGGPATDPLDPISKGPFVFDFPPGTDPALLELDYASALRDDDQHEDAVGCFETLMSTLGLPWSIFIPPVTSPLETSKLNDCKAAIAFINQPPSPTSIHAKPADENK